MGYEFCDYIKIYKPPSCGVICSRDSSFLFDKAATLGKPRGQGAGNSLGAEGGLRPTASNRLMVSDLPPQGTECCRNHTSREVEPYPVKP